MPPIDDLPPLSSPALRTADPTGTVLPTEVGPYRVLALIGRGGMGVVYRAEQDRPARQVALKVLPADRNTPALRRRFEHETAVLARLSHAGIAQIFQAGVTETSWGTLPYFAMELIDGKALSAYAADRSLDMRGRIELVLQICDAVQHAHQQGVVHRDLKPGNILVDAAGHVKVLDFGVAKLVRGDTDSPTDGETKVGDVVGTVEYMSPEQAKGRPEDVDTRTDVYAVGVILYELLAGRRPFDLARKGSAEQLEIIAGTEPPRLGTAVPRCRGDLETIVAKAMEKDKARRYATISETATDLRRYLADEPILARPASVWYLLGKFARKRRPWVISAGFAAFAFLIAAVMATVFWLDGQEQQNKRIVAEQREFERHIEVAMNRGDWQEAFDLSEKALSADPLLSARDLLDQVRALDALCDARGASGIVEKLLARSDLTPAERAETKLWKGDLLLVGGNKGEGSRYIEEALEGPLSAGDKEYGRGLLSGKLADALGHYETAVKLTPYHHGAWTQLAYLKVLAGRWEEAREALAVGEVAFPNDPSFRIVRLVHHAIQGNGASVEATAKSLGPILGEEVAEDLRLAADSLRSSFGDPSKGADQQPVELFRFYNRLAGIALKLNHSPDRQSLHAMTLPPVFEHSFLLLAAAPTRWMEPQYANELKAAAKDWPDAIFFLVLGNILLVQGQSEKAADAFESAMNAQSIFPAVIEVAMTQHMMTLMKIYQTADPESKAKIQPRLVRDVRNLQPRYRGGEAKRLTTPAWDQTMGWIMSDIAWQCGDFDLVREILKEWETVEPNNPILWAQRAQAEYSSAAYGPALEAAQKAQKWEVKDPTLKGNVEFILTDAPKKIRELADKQAPQKPDDKKP